MKDSQKTPRKNRSIAYNPIFIIELYEAAKYARSNAEIAAKVDMTPQRIADLLAKYPHLKTIRNYARKRRKTRTDDTFQNYVFDHLSPEAKETWKTLTNMEAEDLSVEHIQELFERTGEKIQKELFLHSLLKSNWNKSAACRRVGVPLTRIDLWARRDPEFLNLLNEMLIHKKNFCEEALMDLVDQRNPHVVTFVNKTLNGDRGYSEKLQIEHSGSVHHTVGMVPFDLLEDHIDLETRIKLRDGMRAAMQSGALNVDAEEIPSDPVKKPVRALKAE